MSIVIDTSVTMAWCFEDEATDETDRILTDVSRSGAVAPALWQWEVANVLVVAERRGRLTAAQSARFVSLLGQLPIEVTPAPPEIGELVALGRQHGLSSYDAGYLHLAQSTGLALATLDERLRAAARTAGVSVTP